jgi:hypothetical protein
MSVHCKAERAANWGKVTDRYQRVRVTRIKKKPDRFSIGDFQLLIAD